MFGKIIKFFRETRYEMRHVNWPTRKEAVRLTTMVIVFSLVLAAFLGAFDYVFSEILRVLIT